MIARTFTLEVPDARGFFADRPITIRLPDDSVIGAHVRSVVFEECETVNLADAVPGRVVLEFTDTNGELLERFAGSSFFDGFSTPKAFPEPPPTS